VICARRTATSAASKERRHRSRPLTNKTICMKLFLAILAARIVEAQWSFLIDMLRVIGTVIGAIVIIALLIRALH
jgi:hypothetical protein